MNIIKDLKNKLRAFIAEEANEDRSKSCPHCQVSEETLAVLKEKDEEENDQERKLKNNC